LKEEGEVTRKRGKAELRAVALDVRASESSVQKGYGGGKIRQWRIDSTKKGGRGRIFNKESKTERG